jgi:hypothetical protein
MFPPEEAIPEPEYRGVHHLPASALRGVFEQIYALPVAVSYDLARVSQAVASSADFSHPYLPEEPFKRPFSSLLSMDVLRQLRRGALLTEAVEGDVRQRLRTTLGLVRWLFHENQSAQIPFLRLKKRPFRFQGTFDPLATSDLEFLQAHALLENRATMLAVLSRLAQPIQRRRDQLKCFGHLRLLSHRRHGYWHVMTFDIPPDSRQAELSTDTFAPLLTRNDPDVLLDPARWDEYVVQIVDADGESPAGSLTVRVPHDRFVRVFEPLVRDDSLGPWCVDEAFKDPNTNRLLAFLKAVATTETVT